MRNYLLAFFIAFVYFGHSQETVNESGTNQLTAEVINAQTDRPMESVHVVNLNRVVGTITNAKGEFTIPAMVNDTLYLSFLGFKSQKVRVTNDMLRYKNTEISLTE